MPVSWKIWFSIVVSKLNSYYKVCNIRWANCYKRKEGGHTFTLLPVNNDWLALFTEERISLFKYICQKLEGSDSCVCVCVCVYLFMDFLLHHFTSLFVCQYHSLFVLYLHKFNLDSSIMIPVSLVILIMIYLAIQNQFCFQMNNLFSKQLFEMGCFLSFKIFFNSFSILKFSL